jgi:hypothetical protein
MEMTAAEKSKTRSRARDVRREFLILDRGEQEDFMVVVITESRPEEDNEESLQGNLEGNFLGKVKNHCKSADGGPHLAFSEQEGSHCA